MYTEILNKNYLLLILISYLIGSIPSAILISKIMHLEDPRTFGSKNPGATNMLRTGNKIAAIATLIGDISKGYIGLKIVQLYCYNPSTEIICFSAIAILLGHIYPIFTKFIGGKGVATFFGILMNIEPTLAFISFATWLTTIKVFKYSSLSSIIVSLLTPIYYVIFDKILWKAEKPFLILIITICTILLYRHQNNIARLLQNKENKIK
ncbi:glycerol-3-phosphate 1-O-acyltransferase PlsY [Candidatus Kinetoplastidibacterium crithidiae]|uniref:Glycerol-3-phosphate acyltransferase n=1 Tax=Candidatus Kinetoplastidibacterium crithidiae TCC036E TaxID=1208918 RepID=M1LWE3_9PROT|nr:glycerol-3-phosphate 1-O-acyltransferase PlsY [Candidatus Kinetoplastibacterium crithidii]AFZ82793.1 glycerol-3-phosphate acyltransferase [Candidatus Kinetoplastibacterium crithidii (ex Angomonas deanei ATCC 30255)]AGF47554.1 glycerol-3-phosphate acyltransferase PlsY [Candidatus Kinetoplastibacterium crithidii TCC036E]